MQRQMRQLVRLIDDLMEVSRISTGRLVLRTERFREVGRDKDGNPEVGLCLPDSFDLRHYAVRSFPERWAPWECARLIGCRYDTIPIQPAVLAFDEMLSGTFAELMKSQPDAALKIVGGLSRKIQNETHAAAAQRIDNLRAQTVLANLIAENPEAASGSWRQVLALMAESWMTEVENSFSRQAGVPRRGGSGRNGASEIDPEEMLQLAPAGKWQAALPTDLRDRFDASLARHVALLRAA